MKRRLPALFGRSKKGSALLLIPHQFSGAVLTPVLFRACPTVTSLLPHSTLHVSATYALGAKVSVGSRCRSLIFLNYTHTVPTLQRRLRD